MAVTIVTYCFFIRYQKAHVIYSAIFTEDPELSIIFPRKFLSSKTGKNVKWKSLCVCMRVYNLYFQHQTRKYAIKTPFSPLELTLFFVKIQTVYHSSLCMYLKEKSKEKIRQDKLGHGTVAGVGEVTRISLMYVCRKIIIFHSRIILFETLIIFIKSLRVKFKIWCFTCCWIDDYLSIYRYLCFPRIF